MLTQVPNRMMELGSYVPPGAVMSFAMSAAPIGWLPCNGAAINRTTYGPLFSAVGIAFGAGDGSTTFNVPDLRGRFVRGTGSDGIVPNPGVIGTKQSSANKSHTHEPIAAASPWDGRSRLVSGNSSGTDGDLDGSVRITGYDKASIEFNLATEGESEARPHSIVLFYCIKF